MGAPTHLSRLALATLVATSLTACPGGTTETATPPVPSNPRAGVIQQIDQLCLELYKKQQNIMWPDGFEEVGRYLNQQADAIRDWIEKVEEVEAPEEGKQSLDEMLDEARDGIALIERAANVASPADLIEQEDELQEQIEKSNHRFNVAAFRYGLITCSDPKPARVY